MSWLRACALVVAVGLAGAAGASGPAMADGQMLTMDVIMIGSDPTGSGRDRPLRIRISMSGTSQRIDFELLEGTPAHLLIRDGHSWMVTADARAAMPVTARGLDWLWVDPQAPCAAIRVRCTPTGARTIAGVNAQGWRYRHARGRGPEGTDSGELWIDPDTGLLVSFRGRTSRGRPREFHAVSFSLGPVDDAVFALPGGAGPPSPER